MTVIIMYYVPTLVLCATSLTLRPPPLGLSSAPRFFRARLQPYTHLRVISKSLRYSRVTPLVEVWRGIWQ